MEDNKTVIKQNITRYQMITNLIINKQILIDFIFKYKEIGTKENTSLLLLSKISLITNKKRKKENQNKPKVKKTNQK
jgi:hypothetical protein